MFKIEQDRCDYGKLLAAPKGYELEYAVGTTYSLDLEALTFTAIAAGLGEDTDSMLKDNPICLLNALRKVTDKVVLFHEAGRIKIPMADKTNHLYQLLEKMTIPIALTINSGKYPSFHPKMWLICYKENEGTKRLYRFIVMSRNLTFDRSWDVVVALEGCSVKKNIERSIPIAQFLRFLNKFTKRESHQYRIIDMLRSQVKEVEFSLEGTNFHDFTVMPMGIGQGQYNLEEDKWLSSIDNCSNFHEIAIMSPFISNDVIKLFNDPIRGKNLKSCKRTLLTRYSELSKLTKESADNFEIFTLRDEVIDGEGEISEDKDITNLSKQDIHAKMMLVRKYGSLSSLYIGSMNFSHNGFYNNIEFDIRFDCPNSYLGPDSFLKDIFGDNSLNNPFIKQTIQNRESVDNVSNVLELRLKRICRAKAEAVVEQQDPGRFSIKITFDENFIDEGLSIEPISHKGSKDIEKTVIFEGIKLKELTEYYRIKAIDNEGKQLNRILQIHTIGIPSERDKQICNDIIGDKLYDYISFILSEDKIQSLLENGDNSFGEKQTRNTVVLPGIYEKMLEASLHHRERFMELRDIMNMMSEDKPITNEFKGLYNSFCNALKLNDYE